MLELDLTAELDRQIGVCNACRYCEGFCAVFGAAQLRTAIGDGDVAYLANLCHDCRMCYDACMFSPPHEYAIDVPVLMAAGRVKTYEEYARPAAFGPALRSPGTFAAAAVVAGIAGVALVASASPHDSPVPFYAVVPFVAMLLGGLALAAYGMIAVALGARQYARDIGGGERFVTPATLGVALHEALALTYLRGGGAGCYDEGRGSARRRRFHSLVFWGFLADVVATCSAAFMQDVLRVEPPYPLLSVPVLLGTLGGIAIAIGAAGLWVVKRRSDARPMEPRQVALDDAFLVLLEVVALTGLALLAFRATAAMPALLVVHLGAVAGLFVTIPYGKLVHAVYRFIALVKHAHEQRRLS
ncbi:MAG TPA: tricarballylate utilization 4Fe-4S protein TcuB [Candidatus Elarobacter sp.]